MAAELVMDARARQEEAGLGELRREVLAGVQAIVLLLAVLVLIGSGALIARIGETPAYVALALAATAAVSYRLARGDPPAGAAALVAGLVGSLLLALALFPLAPLAALLVVPILIATVLLDLRGGLATLALGGGAVAAALVRLGAAEPLAALYPTLGLGGLVLALAAVLWRPFYTVLDWSWASYAEAQRRTAEVRQRQGELAGLNRGLSQAYERLEQVTAQLERARQAAEEARRLKTEFAASVSHELRTPVNLIIGLSELMVTEPHADGPGLPELYRADAEAIYRNACHVSNLIDDVLDLSQVEAHRMGILREWSALDEIVAQAAATVRTLFDNTGLRLDVQLPALPDVFVDPIRIRQILINLLNNAVRFTEEGGVAISARIEGEQVVVDVADTGVGIAPEDLPGVFHEFWRSGEPVRGRKGSGLGLAVSKRFAELHGGNLWVSSTLGRGSTFSLALPLGEKAVVQEAELGVALWQRIEQRTPESPRVLLVDPEPEALRVFSRYLDGYQVAVVSDLPAALAALGDGPARAAIVGTPTRRDALRRALQERAAAPLPIVTCRLRTARTLGHDLGVVEYLVKPVALNDLRRVLRRFPRPLRDLLIVDDDPEMRHLLGRMVGALAPRCRVRVAGDGLEALELIGSARPDGVLLDLLMPGLDGRSVVERLRADERLASIPVAAITARAAEDDGIVADALEISQPGGLGVGDITGWIKGGLDALRASTCVARPA
ncbi:MAG TPA: ATP-binding protein [Chloroflexota bacterium]|nr:ATP-binding protein [Chloroflexota bacterium]